MANNKPFIIKNGLEANSYLQPTDASGPSGSVFDLDVSTTSYRKITLSGNRSITFSNPPSSGTAAAFTVEVNNSGGYSLSWPSSVKWHESRTPTLATAKNTFIFITVDGGTTYYGRKTEGDIS